MKNTAFRITAAIACLATVSCEQDGDTAGAGEQLASGGLSPAIQHRNSRFDYSGMRLMHPEVLNLVIQKSFGFQLMLDANGDGVETNPLVNNESNDRADRETFARGLGGMDYEGDITRASNPDSVMMLIMDRVSKSLCEDLIASGGLSVATSLSLDNYSQREAAYEYLSRRLASRPLEPAARTALNRLRLAAPTSDAFWQAACVYMTRAGSGSLLLY